MVPPEIKKHVHVHMYNTLLWEQSCCSPGHGVNAKWVGRKAFGVRAVGAAVLHTGPISTAWSPWASHSIAGTIESQKAGFTFQEGCNFTAGLGVKGQNGMKNYWENISGCSWRRVF